MDKQIKQLPDGRYDLQDNEGKSLLDRFGGPYYTHGAAESTQRMLNAFDQVDRQIKAINNSLRDAAIG